MNALALAEFTLETNKFVLYEFIIKVRSLGRPVHLDQQNITNKTISSSESLIFGDDLFVSSVN